MNLGSMHGVAMNKTTYATSWRFYLNCGIEETSSPSIISIVCH